MIGGAQGTGVDTSATIMGNAIAKAGYYIYGNREYYSNIKGRHSYFNLSISDKPVRSISSKVDILVSFDAETVFQHFTEIKDFIIYDSALEGVKAEAVQSMEGEIAEEVIRTLESKGLGNTIKDALTYASSSGVNLIPINYSEVLKRISAEVKLPLSVVDRAKNIIGLGVSLKLLGLKESYLLDVIKSTFKNETFVKINSLAARMGYTAVEDHYHLKEVPISKPRVQIDGNTASAMGKMAAGLRFQTYYPITPASDESVYIEANQVLDMIDPESKEMRKGGVVVVQTEDEIAAVNMAAGAALTGARSATATSGPGFSLMAEGIGWAGMNEAPIVVTYYMRGAPSTGLPTRSGQADLKFAMNVGHGEFPRIVIASGDHVEVFHDAFWSMNLAERYQTPVIHVIEKTLANSYSVLESELFDYKRAVIDRGKIAEPQEGDYFRFRITEDGISPRAFVGKSVMYYTGDEHNEVGHISEAATNRLLMYQKRMRKLETADQEIKEELRVKVEGDSKVALLTWGSPKGAILDAMEDLASEGVRVEMIQVRMFNPYPKRLMRKLLQGKEKIIAIENNYTAQGAQILTESTGIEPTNYVLKWTGRPVTRDEIYKAVKVILERDEKRVILNAGA
jgi:2-oxoglutarate ferredoxin oxidoreductase subunit alpha